MQQQDFITFWQIVSPFLSALLAFASAYILYWIKDRDPSTKEFDRQMKRLQFWKTFYELETIAPIKPRADYHHQCKAALESAAFWVGTTATRGHQYAKHISIALAGIVCAWSFTFLNPIMMSAISKVPGGPNSLVTDTLLPLITMAVLIYFFRELIYQPLREQLTKLFMELAERHVRLSFLKHTV